MLDEPTVGLDPVLRRELWALFHRLADGGAAVLVSSHVMDEAERCDRLLLMREGAIIADGTPRRDPANAPAPPTSRRRSSRSSVRRGPRHEPPDHCSPSPARVLTQLRRDHRTLAMLLVLPCLLITLLWWMFEDLPGDVFDRLGPALLALFPFIVMFLVTSVTTLRERSSGTLERLLAMPMGKLDFLLGYALAFGLVAAVQSRARRGVSASGCSASTSPGRSGCSPWSRSPTPCSAPRSGCSCRRSPRPSSRRCSSCRLVVIPQILLCGLFVPRDALPDVLEAVSDVLPLSYAVDAMQPPGPHRPRPPRCGPTSRVVVAFALAGAGARRGHPAPAYRLSDPERRVTVAA